MKTRVRCLLLPDFQYVIPPSFKLLRLCRFQVTNRTILVAGLIAAFVLATRSMSHAQATATLTTLYSSSGNDGDDPQAELVAGTGGNFYGITYDGGANGYGTVFQITPADEFTNVYMFSGSLDADCVGVSLPSRLDSFSPQPSTLY